MMLGPSKPVFENSKLNSCYEELYLLIKKLQENNYGISAQVIFDHIVHTGVSHTGVNTDLNKELKEKPSLEEFLSILEKCEVNKSIDDYKSENSDLRLLIARLGSGTYSENSLKDDLQHLMFELPVSNLNDKKHELEFLRKLMKRFRRPLSKDLKYYSDKWFDKSGTLNRSYEVRTLFWVYVIEFISSDNSNFSYVDISRRFRLGFRNNSNCSRYKTFSVATDVLKFYIDFEE